MSLTLAQLQQAFIDELAGEQNGPFRALVVDNQLAGKMDKRRRIDIYQRNHIGARIAALANVYPVCQQILGEAAFSRLSSDYVAGSKSSNWDLNHHGGDFNQFLQHQCQQRNELSELFYLADLARLEWLFHRCYYAPANPQYNPNSQDPEQLRFAPDTSLYLFTSQWPVQQIWQNNRDGKGETPVQHDQANYYHVIYRQQYSPQLYNINADAYGLVKDCISGKTLAQLALIHGELVATQIPHFIQHQWLFAY